MSKIDLFLTEENPETNSVMKTVSLDAEAERKLMYFVNYWETSESTVLRNFLLDHLELILDPQNPLKNEGPATQHRFYMTPTQYREVVEKASEMGMKTSKFIRAIILTYMRSQLIEQDMLNAKSVFNDLVQNR